VEGQWVLLQNTHLGLGYLTEVEQFLTKAEDLHEDFRLWITAEPHPQFPIGLLQVGLALILSLLQLISQGHPVLVVLVPAT
jgi:dynein heavy chain